MNYKKFILKIVRYYFDDTITVSDISFTDILLNE